MALVAQRYPADYTFPEPLRGEDYRPPMYPLDREFLDIPMDMQPNFREWRDVNAYKNLTNSGVNYADRVGSILRSEDPLRMDYVRVVGDMYSKAHTAALAFPSRYQEGVRLGMRNLLADSLYAIEAHIHNGNQTQGTLPLNGGDKGLDLTLEGDEPYRLLTVLSDAIQMVSMVRHFGYGERAAVPSENIKVATPADYAMYRFVNSTFPTWPHQVLPVSLYIRPYGKEVYDPRLEYGRPGEGVEASISFVVDAALKPGKLMEVGKHGSHGDDRRISIRLDREGVKLTDRAEGKKDPTQQEGTLSLDVGSILGKDDWTSTKIGRFLAWGNVLRTRSEGITETHLNHMTDYFTTEDGDADIFALQATRLMEVLDNHRVDTDGLKKLFAGRVALTGSGE